MTESILQIKDLKKSFGDNQILKGISLDVKQGEVVVILGSSGCGKSTLLNLLGLLDNPTDGELWFLGQEVSQYTENSRTDLRNGNIGFVLQSFNLIDELTVFENVELPLLYAGVSVKERVERVNATLDRMQIAHRSEHFPQQLSGGQQQRVAIARALITKPAIVLADEPTGNLDSKTSAEVLGLIKRTSAEFRQTVVMITHNDDIARLADRIVRIEDGKIVE